MMLIKRPSIIRNSNNNFGFDPFKIQKKIITPTFNSKSLQFDGIDDAVVVNNNDSLKPFNLTISLWLKVTKTDGENMAFAKELSGGNPSYYIYLAPNGSGGSYLYFGILVPGYRYVFTNINFNQYYNVIATYDHEYIRLFVNNVLASELAVTADIVYSNLPLSIGFFTTTYNQYFGGNLDEISLINKSVNSTERSYIYNSGVPNDLAPFGTDLKLWLRGDGDALPTILDHSGNGNHGTAYNGVVLSTDVP